MKKVILAYSGGLDTSCLIKWLIDKGYKVIAFIADVGQREDFATIKKRALKTGASKVYVLDLQKEFECFWDVFCRFRDIAMEFELGEEDLDDYGWNTSVPKLIDNAIIGYTSR